jgi:hypothetical protein
MAEQRKSSGRSRGGTSRGNSSGGSNSRSRKTNNNNKLTGREAIERVREQIADLLDRPMEGVLGLESTDDGWKVTVEIVELQRIPHSTDVLGAYEAALDHDGELVGYKRQRRYYRNQADED